MLPGGSDLLRAGMSCVRFPAGVYEIYIWSNPSGPPPGAQPGSCVIVTGVRWPWREADHSSPSSAWWARVGAAMTARFVDWRVGNAAECLRRDSNWRRNRGDFRCLMVTRNITELLTKQAEIVQFVAWYSQLIYNTGWFSNVRTFLQHSWLILGLWLKRTWVSLWRCEMEHGQCVSWVETLRERERRPRRAEALGSELHHRHYGSSLETEMFWTQP